MRAMSPPARSRFQHLPPPAHAAAGGLTPEHLELTIRLDAWVNEPGIEPLDRESRVRFRQYTLDWHQSNQGRPSEQTTPFSFCGVNEGPRTLPPALGLLVDLRQFRLQMTQVTELPPEMGNLTQLRVLDVAANQIRELPGWIDRLTMLEVLDVSSNHDIALPEAMGRLQHLRELDLGFTRLARVPEFVGMLTNLESLNLGNNRLTSIPPEIGQLGRLGRLDLEMNFGITEIPDSVIRLAQTCRVQAMGCRISPETAEALRAAAAIRGARVAPRFEVVPALAPRFRLGNEVQPQEPLAVMNALPRQAREMEQVGVVFDLLQGILPGLLAGAGAQRAARAPLPYLIPLDQRPALASHQGQPIEHADSFFAWLDGMPGTDDYRNRRQAMEAKLADLIREMREDVALRRKCFEIAADARTSCGDRRSLGLNLMHEAALNARVLRPGIDEKTLVGLGIETFVLALIDRHARARIATLDATARRGQGWQEDVQTLLTFQTALPRLLAEFGINVSLPIQGMLYRPCAGVSDADLAHCANEIRDEYRDGRSLARFLAQWPPLSKFVEDTHAGDLAAVEVDFRSRLAQLDEANEQGTITESEYVKGSGDLMRGLDAAKKEKHRQLVDELVRRNLQPDLGQTA